MVSGIKGAAREISAMLRQPLPASMLPCVTSLQGAIMPAMHSDMRAFVRVYERVVLHGEWANHHYKNDVGDLSHD